MSLPRVVIIGAGMSGLTAAHLLTKQAGLCEVVVLEARSRIGGRTWTVDVGNSAIDVGGSWIHKTEGNPLTPLAIQYGATLIPTLWDDETRIFLGNFGKGEGKEVSNEDLMEKIFVPMATSSKLLKKRQEKETDLNKSLEQALSEVLDEDMQLTGEERAFARLGWRCEVESEYSVSLKRMSAMYWDQDKDFEGEDCILTTGYRAILEGFKQGVEVRLGQEVTAIDSTGASVVISCTDRETGNSVLVEADHVIFTVPLGVLKNKCPVFTPSLNEEKQRAIQRLGFSVLNKVVLQFESAWWASLPPAHAYFLHSKEEQQSLFVHNVAYHSGDAVLVAYLSADDAQRMFSRPDEEVVEETMSALKAIFGAEHVQPCIFSLVTKWHADEFAFGSYAHMAAGSEPSDYDALARSEHGGRVRFAGEATCREYPSTVHGAHLSGVREATALIKELESKK